ncbi:kinase-like protein [Peniophora sp. CONT]|nr:kinase-like protein [Peniophora sp. CONT]
MGCAQSTELFDGEVSLREFELHRTIGKGAFGTVQVIEHKPTKAVYAVKYVNKAKCMRSRAVQHILQERRLLEKINHPYAVNLRFAFQDDENCFFVLDFMSGGSLRHHLQTQGRFSELTVLYWTAQLSSAISYLHNNGIVHRDIKPDNVLLDKYGNAHVSDFNIAVYSRDLSRPHTSVAGSVAYMAPEVVDPARPGYSWQVDYWSLGVVAYELLWHARPYDGPSADAIMSALQTTEAAIPCTIDGAQMVSDEAIGAIRKFLAKNPSKRLGCRSLMSSLRDVQRHPWFARLNWKELESKKAKLPFVPSEDEANFDLKYEFDAFVNSRKPLAYSKRKNQTQSIPATPTASRNQDADLSYLEEHFTVYDYRAPPLPASATRV